MNIIALATHLKQVAQEAKKYAAGLASELSDATLEAMQEMDNAKADKISAVAVTISTDGWVEDGTWEDYPLRYDITAAGVTAADRADVILSPGSLSAATECGVCQTCETQNGKICIWARTAPAEALSAEYRITQGEKPKED